MEAKLIKTGNEYLLKNLKGEVLAITSGSKEGRMLSLKNCQAIELGYDLDELIDKYCRGNSKIEDDFIKKGFLKALEIIGDKKFSEEDLKYFCTRFAHECRLNGAVTNNDSINVFDTIFKPNYLTLQQTEWDVEIEMDSWFKNGHDGKIVDTNPKLDADGCLILRKI